MTLRSVLALGVTIAALGAAPGAQDRGRGGTVDDLQRVDSSARGHEVVTGNYAWEPNTHTGWHTHPGEMIGHVTAGQLVLEQRGKATTTFRVGETFVVPAGVPHNCVNESAEATRLFVTYVLPKGKALTTPIR